LGGDRAVDRGVDWVGIAGALDGLSPVIWAPEAGSATVGQQSLGIGGGEHQQPPQPRVLGEAWGVDGLVHRAKASS
jgi:hypothetical protein